MKEIQENGFITDNTEQLLVFCSVLEKIFYYGLLPQQNKFGFAKNSEPWMWLEKFSNIEDDTFSFSFKNALYNVIHNCNIQTDLGRFRLFVRLSLATKCLHEPLQYLVKKKRTKIELF